MRFRPHAILALLWLLYFHPLVLHPAQTLYAPYSDFLAEHLPSKLFLNREYRDTGELPLWNPHHFCGSPFVHDLQVGMFYPPFAIVYVVSEQTVGAALSWVIALHVLAAGVFAFWYAHSRGLNEVGSLVVGVGFMLSSKWMTHLLLAGHTVTIGLAWLPLILLLVEHAIATRHAASALGAGAALALLGLGTHPQFALYAGLFALLWTLPTERTRVLRWFGGWFAACAIAALLDAVQLFPTLEASQWSARSSGLDAMNTLTLGVHTLFALVGPSRAYAPPNSWELQGVFGLFWLGAAAAAPLLAPQWNRQFAVFCGLLVFALGGAVLLDWLPLLDRFRVPTRALVIAAFPLAFLAGAATDAITRSEWSGEARLALSRGFRRAMLFAGVPTVLGLVFSDGVLSRAFVAYCVALLVSLVAFVRILQPGRLSARSRTCVWCGILLADLVAPIAALPDVRPQAELYPSSLAMNALAAHAQPVRVLDWDTGSEAERESFLGIGAPLAMVHGVDTPRGYNPLDVRHYREFIAFVVDDPRPVRGNSPYTQQVLPNFEVGNPELFRLLCVTHRVVPADAPTVPGNWKPLLTDPAPPAPPPLLPASPDRLPPHTLTEARDARPRAWIVPRAEPMPAADALAALKRTDFSQTVLLSVESAPSHPPGARPGTARIASYRANRVSVELDGTGGWLVLSDVWFPGWKCEIDGAEVEVYRANHAFRAAPVPAGARHAEFVFAPRSYLVGRWVSLCSLSALVAAFVIGLIVRRRSPRPT
jgi:hypothetical protein